MDHNCNAHILSFYGCNEKITKEQEAQAIISAMALHDSILINFPSDHLEFVSVNPAFSKSMQDVFLEKFSSLDVETVLYYPETSNNTVQIPDKGRHWNITYKQCLEHKDSQCLLITIVLYDPCLGVHEGSHHYVYHYQKVFGEWVCVSD